MTALDADRPREATGLERRLYLVKCVRNHENQAINIARATRYDRARSARDHMICWSGLD
jgi:hypothetical protein